MAEGEDIIEANARMQRELADAGLNYEAHVPGLVTVRIVDGGVDKIIFTPYASSAGHFGPSAIWSEGDDDSQMVDLEDTDGPFWRAVQNYGDGRWDDPVIHWEE